MAKKAKKTKKKATSKFAARASSAKKKAQKKKASANKKTSAKSIVPEVVPEVLPASIGEEPQTAPVPTSSSSDPLQRYMTEAKRFPLLSAEAEFELAKKLRETGDLEAAKKLVQANLRLVVKIAFEYRTMYANMLDLVQEGNIGLMKAVSNYDPDKGARLSYYASWWIRSYVLKYILDNFRLVKIGTTQAQKKLFYHLVREKQRLEAMGYHAGPKLLAEKLDVKESEVVEMEQRLSAAGAEMSLDTPISADSGSMTFTDLIEDQGTLQDSSFEKEQLLEILKERLPEFIETLADREKVIVQDRILSEQPKTLQEIADSFSMTRERVRQIEAKTIEKLREFLRPQFG